MTRHKRRADVCASEYREELKPDIPNFTLMDRELICLFAHLCKTFRNKVSDIRSRSADNTAPVRDVSAACGRHFVVIDNQTGLIVDMTEPIE